MSDAFHLQVVTPEAAVVDESVTYVEVPAHDGQLGVMRQRAPLVLKLSPGKLRLVTADGSSRTYFVEGGFAQMRNERLSVLSERCLPIDQIDAEQAREDLTRAASLPASTEHQFKKRQHELDSARARTNLAPAGA